MSTHANLNVRSRGPQHPNWDVQAWPYVTSVHEFGRAKSDPTNRGSWLLTSLVHTHDVTVHHCSHMRLNSRHTVQSLATDVLWIHVNVFKLETDFVNSDTGGGRSRPLFTVKSVLGSTVWKPSKITRLTKSSRFVYPPRNISFALLGGHSQPPRVPHRVSSSPVCRGEVKTCRFTYLPRISVCLVCDRASPTIITTHLTTCAAS